MGRAAVTLVAFQPAVAELVASPERCLLVRTGGDAALGGHELDARERRRLIALAGAPGMSVNCSLHRATGSPRSRRNCR